MTKVFVYGTLKRGGSNHHFLAGQQFLGEATTVPGYALYSLGDYPGMVRSNNTAQVVTGEVWSVDDACLARLDKLEGVEEGLYIREAITLIVPFSDQSIETYIYLRSLEGHTALGSTWSG
jgi:gamma-glutamylaminecyclotransferase